MVDIAINKACSGLSKLTPGILSIVGMSSALNRHLLNNLGEGKTNYLEIGVNKGSTFISSLYQNNIKEAYAIENWSQYNDDEPKNQFINNCWQFDINCHLIEQNAFEVDTNRIKDIDFYFYDGDHHPEEQKKALTYFYPCFTDRFLFVVDDYDWKGVQSGTKEGIKECGLKVLYERYLESGEGNNAEGWWNGVGIFILEKNGKL